MREIGMSGQKQFDPTEALEAAMLVFWRNGFHQTSVQDLTEATGLGRGSLYGAFGNKEQLFLAALSRYQASVAAENLAALTSRPDDHRAAIAAFFAVIIERLQRNGNPRGCLGVNTANELPTYPPQLQHEARALMQDQVSAISAVFEQALKRKAIAPSTSVVDLTNFVLETSRALASMHRAGESVEAIRGVAHIAMSAIPARQPAK